MSAEPCFDIAHLGHVELFTYKPQESLDFFVDIFGLTESGREGDSVYLRAWDDYEFHTLKLTAAKTTGVGHIGYRASSEAALLRRVAAIEAMGCGIGWSEGDLGHGRAYRFRDPDEHVFEIYFETNKYAAPEKERPALKNQAQRNHGRGCAVRRLDHLNLLAQDVAAIRDFMPKALGSRVTEQIVLDSGEVGGCWFTVNNKSYDIAYTRDHTPAQGRFHHVTYAVDQREHTQLRSRHAFFDDDRIAGRSEDALDHRLPNRGDRLLLRAADSDALSRRQSIGLDHHRITELAAVEHGPGRSCVVAHAITGRRNAMFRHEVLGEDLAALQPGGRGGRPKDLQPS